MPEADRAKVRFVADAMLGSFARKLRVLGFDTIYYKTGGDAGIMRIASAEGRVILTADRQLASRTSRGRTRIILVSGRNDAARLRNLKIRAGEFGLTLERGNPFCSVCNGELTEAGKLEVADRVPRSVASRHRLFYRCRNCGKLYWKGGHWKKLRSFERLLRDA
jgi:uncharacterized protein with PIN domain